MKQKIIFFLLFIATFILNNPLNAQGWIKTFSNPTYKGYLAQDVIETPDSGFVFSSFRNSLLFVVKTNKQGDTLWTYSASNMPYGNDSTKIFRTAENNIVVLFLNVVSSISYITDLSQVKNYVIAKKELKSELCPQKTRYERRNNS